MFSPYYSSSMGGLSVKKDRFEAGSLVMPEDEAKIIALGLKECFSEFLGSDSDSFTSSITLYKTFTSEQEALQKLRRKITEQGKFPNEFMSNVNSIFEVDKFSTKDKESRSRLLYAGILTLLVSYDDKWAFYSLGLVIDTYLDMVTHSDDAYNEELVKCVGYVNNTLGYWRNLTDDRPPEYSEANAKAGLHYAISKSLFSQIKPPSVSLSDSDVVRMEGYIRLSKLDNEPIKSVMNSIHTQGLVEWIDKLKELANPSSTKDPTILDNVPKFLEGLVFVSYLYFIRNQKYDYPGKWILNTGNEAPNVDWVRVCECMSGTEKYKILKRVIGLASTTTKKIRTKLGEIARISHAIATGADNESWKNDAKFIIGCTKSLTKFSDGYNVLRFIDCCVAVGMQIPGTDGNTKVNSYAEYYNILTYVFGDSVIEWYGEYIGDNTVKDNRGSTGITNPPVASHPVLNQVPDETKETPSANGNNDTHHIELPSPVGQTIPPVSSEDTNKNPTTGIQHNLTQDSEKESDQERDNQAHIVDQIDSLRMYAHSKLNRGLQVTEELKSSYKDMAEQLSSALVGYEDCVGAVFWRTAGTRALTDDTDLILGFMGGGQRLFDDRSEIAIEFMEKVSLVCERLSEYREVVRKLEPTALTMTSIAARIVSDKNDPIEQEPTTTKKTDIGHTGKESQSDLYRIEKDLVDGLEELRAAKIGFDDSIKELENIKKSFEHSYRPHIVDPDLGERSTVRLGYENVSSVGVLMHSQSIIQERLDERYRKDSGNPRVYYHEKGWLYIALEKFEPFWKGFLDEGPSVELAKSTLKKFYESLGDNVHKSLNTDTNSSDYSHLTTLLHYAMIHLKHKWENEERYDPDLENYRNEDTTQRCMGLIENFFDFEEMAVKEANRLTGISGALKGDHKNLLHDRHVQFIKSISVNTLPKRYHLENFSYLADMALYYTLCKLYKGDARIPALRKSIMKLLTAVVRWIEKERAVADGSLLMESVMCTCDFSYSVNDKSRVDPFSYPSEGLLWPAFASLFEFAKDSENELMTIYYPEGLTIRFEEFITDNYKKQLSKVLSQCSEDRDMEYCAARCARITAQRISDDNTSSLLYITRSENVTPCCFLDKSGMHEYVTKDQFLLDLIGGMGVRRVSDNFLVHTLLGCAVMLGIAKVDKSVTKSQAWYYTGLYSALTAVSVPFGIVVGSAYGNLKEIDPLAHMGKEGVLSKVHKVLDDWNPIVHRKDDSKILKSLEMIGDTMSSDATTAITNRDTILGSILPDSPFDDTNIQIYEKWMRYLFDDGKYTEELERHFGLLRWMAKNDLVWCRKIIYSSCIEYLLKNGATLAALDASVNTDSSPQDDSHENNSSRFMRHFSGALASVIPRERVMTPNSTGMVLYAETGLHYDNSPLLRRRDSVLHNEGDETRVWVKGHYVENDIIRLTTVVTGVSERLRQGNESRRLYFIMNSSGVFSTPFIEAFSY